VEGGLTGTPKMSNNTYINNTIIILKPYPGAGHLIHSQQLAADSFHC